MEVHPSAMILIIIFCTSLTKLLWNILEVHVCNTCTLYQKHELGLSCEKCVSE